jgi:uncharacterized protein YjbI with pentapeptide repeats
VAVTRWISRSAAVAACLIIVLALAPAGAGAASPTDQPIGLIYVQGARHGTLNPVKGRSVFQLTLRRTDPQTLAFETSPVRQSWQVPTRGFLGSWTDLGFSHDSPSAVLSLLHGDPSAATLAVKLTHPRKKNHGRWVRFRARPVDGATGNLANFDSQLDKGLPRHFGTGSLFIDDATGPVVPCTDGNLCNTQGCVIQPYAHCGFADLDGAYLRGAFLYSAALYNADLRGANLEDANVNHTTFDNANMTDVVMDGADMVGVRAEHANMTRIDIGGASAYYSSFNYSDLTGADLNYANLDYSTLVGADLSDAKMLGTGLISAQMQGANLTGADLTGANWRAADVSNATFCHTIRPDGAVDNSDCPAKRG